MPPGALSTARRKLDAAKGARQRLAHRLLNVAQAHGVQRLAVAALELETIARYAAFGANLRGQDADALGMQRVGDGVQQALAIRRLHEQ